jgi:opacity protein-like surface antigen
MKKTLLVFAAILLFGLVGFAQTAEYPKFELAGTASVLVADVDVLGNETMWGYGISGQGNFNKYFGIVGEWTTAHGQSTFDNDGDPLPIDLRVQTLLFGPRISYRAKPVTVFGHFLVGAATLKADDKSGFFDFNSVTNWQVAYAIGGGLDINVGKNFAIRAIQLDYLFMDSDLSKTFDPNTVPGAFNNLRYQFGAVFKF